MSFSSQKAEFDRFFNRLDQLVEESRPDRPVDPTGFHLCFRRSTKIVQYMVSCDAPNCTITRIILIHCIIRKTSQNFFCGAKKFTLSCKNLEQSPYKTRILKIKTILQLLGPNKNYSPTARTTNYDREVKI